MRARYSFAPRSPQTDVADSRTKGLRDGETPQGSQLEARARECARSRCARPAALRARAAAQSAVPPLAAVDHPAPDQPGREHPDAADQQPASEPEPQPEPDPAGHEPGPDAA